MSAMMSITDLNSARKRFDPLHHRVKMYRQQEQSRLAGRSVQLNRAAMKQLRELLIDSNGCWRELDCQFIVKCVRNILEQADPHNG